VAQLNSGSVITISSELTIAEEDVLAAAPSPLRLPETSSLVQHAEVQER
jgi:hypothetical protein